MTDVEEMRTAREIREVVVAGRVRPQEIVKRTMERIEEHDAQLHSLLTVDAEHAYQQADLLEARARAGELPGPLWGVPFTVKDLYDTAGVRTTYGSRIYADHVPDHDAELVARIRRAGGILVGKSNTPEFAIYIRTDNDLAEETRNPWALDRTCGGSSGGAAASVAAGITPIAVGSDGGGSIRIPSALCGTIGLKPSLGSVPGTGGRIGTRRFSAVGPMTMDVTDAEVLWHVMRGPHVGDPTWTLARGSEPPRSSERPLRIRWIGDSGVPGAESDVLSVTHDAAVDLAALLGAELDEPGTSLDAPRFADRFYDIMQADRVSSGGGDLLADERTRDLLTDYARHQFERGSLVSGAAYSAGVKAQLGAVAHLEGLLAGVDAVVTPTLGFVAPLLPEGRTALPEDARRGSVAFTFLMNFTGYPALSVPCGLVRGLPVAIQLIGRPGHEPRLLDLARRYQDSIFRLPTVLPRPVATTSEEH
ncbi:amidase [Nocardioides sp. GXZ039]|uniref:amidase n=1 Tax=Nocardioides sp. GXZ039 TaxID=3136018 RepID=UPI0030F3D420